MGNCCTNITEQPESTNESVNVKILLLGTSSCGKTTFIKQFKKINQDNYDNDNYNDNDSKDNISSTYIRDIIITDMKTLCLQHCKSVNLSIKNQHFCNEILELKYPYNLTNDIAYKIAELYKDIRFRELLLKKDSLCIQLHLNDNIEYFLNKIDLIQSNDYIPSFEDCMKMNNGRTIGYSLSKFLKYDNTYNHLQYIFEIADIGGAQIERRKWWNYMQLLPNCNNYNQIIYVVAISEYNMVLYEDNTVNRLIDSINCFEKVIQTLISRNYFRNKSVSDSIKILFNKYDIFLEKIRTIPITVTFNDFPNNNPNMNPYNSNDVIKFIAHKYLSILIKNNVNFLNGKPLQIIRTIAVDTENVNKMFTKISQTIFQNINDNKLINNKLITINEEEKYEKYTNDFIAPLMTIFEQKQCSNPNPLKLNHVNRLPRLSSINHSVPISVKL